MSGRMAHADVDQQRRSAAVLDVLRAGASLAVILHHMVLAAMQPVTLGRSEIYALFHGSRLLQVRSIYNCGEVGSLESRQRGEGRGLLLLGCGLDQRA